MNVLAAPLSVEVEPKQQVVDYGRSATFKCNYKVNPSDLKHQLKVLKSEIKNLLEDLAIQKFFVTILNSFRALGFNTPLLMWAALSALRYFDFSDKNRCFGH